MKSTTNKIALCISGQMRSFKLCAPSINENIIKPNDADVFIYTWEYSGKSRKIDKSKIKNIKITKDLLKDTYINYKDSIIEPFYKEYFNKKDEVKVPKILKEKEPVHYKGSIPMFYGMWICNNLRKSFGKYDIIIRLRPDMCINDTINLLNKNIKSILYSSSISLDPSIQISDKFAYGNEEIMNYYFSVWNVLNIYWKSPLSGNSSRHTNRVGERLLKYHFDISKYNYKYFDNKNTYVLRTDKTKMKI